MKSKGIRDRVSVFFFSEPLCAVCDEAELAASAALMIKLQNITKKKVHLFIIILL